MDNIAAPKMIEAEARFTVQWINGGSWQHTQFGTDWLAAVDFYKTAKRLARITTACPIREIHLNRRYFVNGVGLDDARIDEEVEG
jgi:hypothetical protein